MIGEQPLIHQQKHWSTQITLLIIIAALLLTACNSATPSAEVIPTTPSQTATPVPTAVPLKTLVVCLGEEPNSLYLYNNPSASAWSVLEAIYDGPIDTINYQPQPVILEELPTQENGRVELSSVEVSSGDLVANTEGDIVALSKGVKVFPENCTSSDCAVEYDGVSAIRVTQMSASFKLKAGLTWSDGSALTADDSVYSYLLATDPSTLTARHLTTRTASYAALDAQTVKWTGKPGYLTQNPAAFFFSPLPQHQLNNLSPQDLQTSTLANKEPLGWGPYLLDEWVSGDHIRLVKNPRYFRAAENLPYFDVLVYRFIGSGTGDGLAGLTSGECDILDTTVNMEDPLQSVLDLQKSGQAKVYLGQGPEWEALNFGIKPASYDDTYNPWIDRQDFFGDVRTRQALTYCINREKLTTALFGGEASVPATYLPPNHPWMDSALAALPHDPQKGSALLDEVGWKDRDSDPRTARVSTAVAGVLDGTEFRVSYTAAESALHRKVAESIAADLLACGVGVNVELKPVGEVYASAPDGPIFGRHFDLAEVAWTVGRFPPCYLFSSSEIPTQKNSWLGTRYGGVNFTGYANPEYDQACRVMLTAGLSTDAFSQANQTTQQILGNDVPAIALFYHVHALVTRPEICGVTLDVSSRSALRTIEEWGLEGACN
jgi:peptide/nickel transport system substrate-binding protein